MRLAVAILLVAAPSFAQDLARMEQVIQASVQNKTFMGTVLVARGYEILLSKGYGLANLEWDIPNTPSTKFRTRLDHQAVHGRLDSVARGTREAQDRGSHQEAHARRARRVGGRHHLQPLDPHVGNPELHRLAGVQQAAAVHSACRQDHRGVSRQTAGLRTRRTNVLQQLGIPGPRPRHRDGHGCRLRGLPAGEHLHAARHEGLGIRFELRDHRAARSGLHAESEGADQHRLHSHDHPARCRRRCTRRPRICCAGSRA